MTKLKGLEVARATVDGIRSNLANENDLVARQKLDAHVHDWKKFKTPIPMANNTTNVQHYLVYKECQDPKCGIKQRVDIMVQKFGGDDGQQ